MNESLNSPAPLVKVGIKMVSQLKGWVLCVWQIVRAQYRGFVEIDPG